MGAGWIAKMAEERKHHVVLLLSRMCNIFETGQRFGFVRFLNVQDPEVLERRLDQIFIGKEKLFVNLPKFSK